MSRNLPTALRKKIILAASEREPFECPFCHFKFLSIDDPNIHVDHVIPYAYGGETVEENLQVTCRSCNESKAAAAAPVLNRKKILREVLCCRCRVVFRIPHLAYQASVHLVAKGILLCKPCGGVFLDEPVEGLDSRFTKAKKGDFL